MAKPTEASLRKPPEQPRQLLLDDSGLRARHGVRGWSFFFRQYHGGGKYRTVTLGRYPELSLRGDRDDRALDMRDPMLSRRRNAVELVDAHWREQLGGGGAAPPATA